MKKSVVTGISATLAIAAAAALMYAPAVSAGADDIALDPVRYASDISYHYFSQPTSVHADASGLYIADGDRIVTVAPDMSFTERDITCDKAMRYNECFITLEHGALAIYYGNVRTEYSAAADFIDFDTCGDRLYAISRTALTTIPLNDTDFNEAGATVVTIDTAGYSSINATAVAAAADKVYVAVDAKAFSSKQDVITVDAHTGATSEALPHTDPVASMSVMEHSDAVYILTRGGITAYLPYGGGLVQKYTVRDTRMTSLYAYDGFVYALDTLNGVYRISAELGEFRQIIASASDADGFFNMPTGAAVKNSTLFVADSANNRVVSIGSGLSYLAGDFINPVSVACDSGGAVYVAHSYGKVTAVTGDSATDIAVDGTVKQIAEGTSGELYILTSTGLYISKELSAPRRITDTCYKAITLSAGRSKLYALADDRIDLITPDGDGHDISKQADAPAEAFSLAVDFAGNAFLLTVDGVTRIDAGSNAAEHFGFEDGYVFSYPAGQILFSTVDNSYTHYGDAIIVDTYKHRLFTVDGATLRVKLIDDSYDVPDVSGTNTANETTDRIIRVALYDTPVFSLPMETVPVYKIAKDRKVIVAQYDLPETPEYSLVLIDDLATGRLVQGYVYKDSLSAPLPYVDPPSTVASVYSKATPVYKWPSHNSKTILGYSAVDRSTTFTVLKFVDGYRDDYNNLWYRVLLSDGSHEGYILSVNLSMMAYEPVFIRPAYDAEIISYEGSEFARCYTLDGDEYSELNVTLATGTKVEVIGAFDSSKRYTQIKYLDSTMGTLTCYVETVYIKYSGSNVVPFVAAAVIIITLILGGVIIARVTYLKHHRLAPPPTEPETDQV